MISFFSFFLKIGDSELIALFKWNLFDIKCEVVLDYSFLERWGSLIGTNLTTIFDCFVTFLFLTKDILKCCEFFFLDEKVLCGCDME